ncbi:MULTISPECIES: GNAT family N-acetyltransferase [Bacillaceae]|uniref:GCN5 family acetyltransferase n=1 Tax=Alkalicoccobacillus plakortidis TaxID=444060 RepID=A0A9D5DR94_9BACI|nr:MULTISPECIES: GNAT family N-acetyltransferase [Bacillaceae]KQL56521.1 GCN5 family acetyltransferase [Alkalicoccobacillus plakortidis]
MITIKVGEMITPQQLASVFQRSTINRPLEDLNRLEEMLKYGNLLVTAWDGEKLIGVARSLTDYAYCCYLSDLAVDTAYQFQGIGRQLVDKTKDEIGENVTLLLRASVEAMDYYPKLGFEQIENGFAIPRKA